MKDRKLTMEELGRVTPEDHRRAQKMPVRVVLDDVRSRHNVGAVFRTADAFGIDRLVLGGFTPLPPHREIEKTALGATLSVPWEHAPDTVAAVRALKASGFTIWAVEQTANAIALGALPYPLPAPLAIILGNELTGVSDPVIAECDACVVIPQRGSKHSLNVSVCAGIVLWTICGALPRSAGHPNAILTSS
jgi:tRNA G18 (ribose-2'-O)-methylase SpoU